MVLESTSMVLESTLDGIGINLKWYWNQPQMVLESTSNDIGINLGRYWNQPQMILESTLEKSEEGAMPLWTSWWSVLHRNSSSALGSLVPRPIPPSFPYCKRWKAGWGLGTRLSSWYKNCAMSRGLRWSRSWPSAIPPVRGRESLVNIVQNFE